MEPIENQTQLNRILKMKMQKHLKLLGFPVKDKVTGYEGVVTSINFELYGCIQAIVSGKLDAKGEIPQGKWFDVTRLEIQSIDPVMLQPDFKKGYISTGKKGAEMSKPLPSNEK